MFPLRNLHNSREEALPGSNVLIRIVSPGFGHLSSDIAGGYGLTHRKPYYFFLFMLEGSIRHGVDLGQFDINNNELLFVLPHQVHRLPATNYFKIGFDEDCLSLLPKQYPFLINPSKQVFFGRI